MCPRFSARLHECMFAFFAFLSMLPVLQSLRGIFAWDFFLPADPRDRDKLLMISLSAACSLRLFIIHANISTTAARNKKNLQRNL